MTKRDTAPKNNLLPALLVAIVACIAGAGALTWLSRNSSPAAAPADQLSLVVERIPFQAQNALRGDPGAFDGLAKSMARLKNLPMSGPLAERQLKLEPGWSKFGSAASTVAEARAAVETIQAANQETRDSAPKLLSELGDLASAVGVQKLEGMSRYLERFEN